MYWGMRTWGGKRRFDVDDTQFIDIGWMILLD